MQQEDSFSDALRPAPPLIQHQQASTFPSRSDDGSPIGYRSLAYGGSVSEGAYAESYSEAYEEPPVYRSISTLFCDDRDFRQYLAEGGAAGDGCGMHSGLQCGEAVEPPAPIVDFHFELPRELFETVLSTLPSHPDLFNAMNVSRYWCEEARAVYARRMVRVQPHQDDLLRAAACATAGDTLLLEPGLHWLSSELLVEKPLRLGASTVGAATVLATRCPSLLRTRATVQLHGLTFCRMGDAEGHPNAVIVAESAALSAECCRVTCGGPATSVEQALLVFQGATVPGGAWQQPPPPQLFPPAADDAAGATRQGPQSGVWVGACASVTLRRNIIACCSGPGVKIYRGRLLAEGNTVAFSRCGANVVSNSGRVTLTHNAIHGARGDGVSSWNNSHIALENNTIHSNRGTGITINTGGGSVSIARNSFFANELTAVQFSTSLVKKVTIGQGEHANDWSCNAAGGLRGLQLEQRPSAVEPSTEQLQPGAFVLEPGSSGSSAVGALPAAPLPFPSGYASAGSGVTTAYDGSASAGSCAASVGEPMEVDADTLQGEPADEAGGGLTHGYAGASSSTDRGSSRSSLMSGRSGWSVEMG